MSDRALKWVSLAVGGQLLAASMTGVIMQNAHEHADQGLGRASIEAEALRETITTAASTTASPRALHEAARDTEKSTTTPTTRTARPTDTGKPFTWREVRLAREPAAPTGDALKHMAKLAVPHSLTDVSYPQCEGVKSDNYKNIVDMEVVPAIRTGLHQTPLSIVGVTGGKPFTANRCLADLARVPQHYDFYVNAANPGLTVMRRYVQAPYHCKPSDRGCIAEAYGGLTANHALQLVQKAGLHAPHGYWWIDVETMNAWRGDGYENRRVLTGIIKALQAADPHARIGFYSAPTSIKHPDRASQWTKITGVTDKHDKLQGWLNGYDSWIATGSGTEQQALAACKERQSFTGGRLVLSQFSKRIGTETVDADVLCRKS